MRLVESIIEQDAKTQLGHKKQRRPLDVLLVSNDVSLFCDTNEASHKRATSRFWDLVKPFFQDSTLRSIQIVVVKTGTVALAKPPEEYDMNHVPTKTYKSPGTASDEREDDDDDRMEVDDDEAKMPSKESKQAEEESEARSMHEILIAKCTRTLQALLISRSEEAYKTNRSYAAIGNPIAPVEISFTMVDATVHPRLGFKSLFRRCLRDIVSSIMAFHAMAETGDSVGQLSSANSNCIHLELPETLDGTQCSISLEVSYKTLPFSLDRSVVTKGFFSDLNELVQSKMEIVQLVPISCVDASLLFGVPMRVRAGLEGDLEQYQEALVLVQSLFRLMQQKEVAMLLRVQDEVDDESTNKNAVETIFHNTKKSQTFLLMAEEKVAGDCPPSTGILFRYASAEELLLEQAKPLSHVNISLPEEVTKQYESYVDNALDLFECSALNPLYLDAMMTPDNNKRLNTKNKFPTSYCDNEEDDLWNDDVGIGALAIKQGVNDIVGKDPKNAMDLDDDNDDNFCLFDYSQVND